MKKDQKRKSKVKSYKSAVYRQSEPHWAWKALVLLNIFVLLPTFLFFVWLAYQNDHGGNEPEVVGAILWPFYFVALLTYLADIPALMLYSYRNFRHYQKSRNNHSLKKSLLAFAVLIMILFYSLVGGAVR